VLCPWAKAEREGRAWGRTGALKAWSLDGLASEAFTRKMANGAGNLLLVCWLIDGARVSRALLFMAGLEAARFLDPRAEIACHRLK